MVTKKAWYVKIDKVKSSKFHISSTDGPENIEVKIVYSLRLPPPAPPIPTGNIIRQNPRLVFQVRDKSGNVIFVDNDLPLTEGDDLIYTWRVEVNDSLRIVPGYNYYPKLMLCDLPTSPHSDESLWTLIRFRVYLDRDRKKILADYHDSQGNRYPAFLFGATNYIYVKVKIPDEYAIFTDGIKVSSDAYVYINNGNLALCEKSAEYPNYNYKTIKVLDEEFLTFKLKINTSAWGIPPDYYEALKIKVDRAEYGLDWQDYRDFPTPEFPGVEPLLSGEVNFAQSCSQAISTNINLKPPSAPDHIVSVFHWFLNFVYSNILSPNNEYPSYKKHFHKETDKNFADSVDLVARIGHGGVDADLPGEPPYLLFAAEKNGALTIERLYHNKCSFGENDVEFLVFQSCYFLKAEHEDVRIERSNPKLVIEDLSQMMNGAHVVCGYTTIMYFDYAPDQLKRFIDEVRDGESIKDAWKISVRIYQPKKVTGRAFFLKNCADEKIYPSPDQSGLMPLLLEMDNKNEYGFEDFIGGLE